MQRLRSPDLSVSHPSHPIHQQGLYLQKPPAAPNWCLLWQRRAPHMQIRTFCTCLISAGILEPAWASDAFTFFSEKCNPDHVSQSDNFRFQDAFLTRCDVRPYLPIETAQRCSGPGWSGYFCCFLPLIRCFVAGVPGHGVIGADLPPGMDDKDTERPAFNGVSCKASSIYLNAAEDFHLPSVPISCIATSHRSFFWSGLWFIVDVFHPWLYNLDLLDGWSILVREQRGVLVDVRVFCQDPLRKASGAQPRALQVTTAFQRPSDTMCSLVHLGLLNEQGDGPVEVVDCPSAASVRCTEASKWWPMRSATRFDTGSLCLTAWFPKFLHLCYLGLYTSCGPPSATKLRNPIWWRWLDHEVLGPTCSPLARLPPLPWQPLTRTHPIPPPGALPRSWRWVLRRLRADEGGFSLSRPPSSALRPNL